MRLRAAISQGAIQVAATGYVGPAVVTAARLLDSSVLRTALAKGSSSDLAVIVTDDLYRDVVSQGHSGLVAAMFRRVSVSNPGKAFKATGWLRVVDPPAADPAVVLPAVAESGGTGRGWGAGVAAALGGAALGAAAGLSLSGTSWDLFGGDHDAAGDADTDDYLHHDGSAGDHQDYDDHGDHRGEFQ
jgi:hypothetical protein